MLKDDIENIVASACDGTWNGLERATFVWNSSPQEMADKLVAYIERLLTQRALDGLTVCQNCGGWLKGGECENCNSPLAARH